MKKMMLTLIVLLTMAMQANAMSYEQARNEALFLTDKMAYELNLTDAQYEACYEINLDYLMGVTSRHDVFGPFWERRNLDLSYVLYTWQWDMLRTLDYFYRPLYWHGGFWHFGIYARYPHRDYFYFGRPHFYASYRGGHSWHRNNGRSFYEHRVTHYRPNPGLARDRHVGMRNNWERGDYRSGRSGSSTRYQPNERNPRNDNRGAGNVNRGTRNDNRDVRSGGSAAPSQRGNGDGVYGAGSSRSSNSTYSGNARSGSNSTPSRSVGSTPSRSVGSTPSRSTPSRSVGGSGSSRSGSVGSAPSRSSGGSAAPSRSAGGNRGGGNQGGGRR